MLQPFEDREDNFVGAQHTSVSDGVNTAAMKFERGHPFLTNWIYEVVLCQFLKFRNCEL